MRITIQAVVEVDGGAKSKHTLDVVERAGDYSPQSGLGLFIAETHDLLKTLQSLMIGAQADEFARRASQCTNCEAQLAIKASKSVVYRTAYGKARLASPRLYTSCSNCGESTRAAATFSPLAEALQERAHPQWKWLQTRYAGVMSYKLAKLFLRDAFPGRRT